MNEKTEENNYQKIFLDKKINLTRREYRKGLVIKTELLTNGERNKIHRNLIIDRRDEIKTEEYN